ncbi:MAG: hypothetical protein QG635_2110 [Bacteroidota bacterium]|nr:hypothetical protein [Bacteroidota bacterium]
MREKDISILLKKADELKALFVLGQRVIPFLEEIFIFVSEIKPLLDEINTSIAENLKKMPNASKQLSKVTEATEMATTEIMDIVDGVVYKADIIQSHIEKIIDIDKERAASPLKVLELIYKSLQKGQSPQEIMPKIAKVIQGMKASSNKEFEEAVNQSSEILQSLKEDSSSIMMSLQVQDITSQQIAAVNHLLETVQGRLSKILEYFQATDVSSLVQTVDESYHERQNVTKLHRNIAFDPEAVDSITMKDTRQGLVDEYMRNHNEGLDDEDSEGEEDLTQQASLSDIDSMFNKSNGADEEVQEEPAAVEVEEDNFAQFSQDDIDALFGK